MKNIISHKEQTCEEYNNKQIKIYNDQIKLVEDKICKKCKTKFWEDLDLVLRHYYYEQVDQDEDLLPFDLDLIKKKFRCKKKKKYP